MQGLEVLRRILQAGTEGYLGGYVPAQKYNEGIARDDEQNRLANLFRQQQFGFQQDQFDESKRHNKAMEEAPTRNYLASVFADRFGLQKPEKPEPPNYAKTPQEYFMRLVQTGQMSEEDAAKKLRLFDKPDKPTAASKTPSTTPTQRASGVQKIIGEKLQNERDKAYDPENPNWQEAEDVKFWNISNPKAVDSANVLFNLLSGGAQGGETTNKPTPTTDNASIATAHQPKIVLDEASYDAATKIGEVLKSGRPFNWDAAMKEHPNLDWANIKKAYGQ